MSFMPMRRRRRDEDDDQFLVDAIPPEVLPDALPPNMPLPGPRGYSPPPGVPRGMPPAYRQSRGEEFGEAKDVWMKGTQGRKKSALIGALRGAVQGLARGQGLGGAVGGALGGALGGGINPRGLREQQFNEQIAPQIQSRWGMADAESMRLRQAAQDEQNAMMNQAKIEEIQSSVDFNRARAEQARLPRPVKGPAPSWKLGVNRRTGAKDYYNAADPMMATEFEPYVEDRKFSPHWVETAEGYKNLNDPNIDPSKVRKLQRPKAAAKPKGPRKTIAVSDLRAWAEENNMSPDRAAAKWKADGYEIVRTP